MNTLPYGTWPSVITEKTLTENALKFSEIACSGNTLYWLEGRPEENGHVALMSEHKELVPSVANIKSRVHEYGGGAFTAKGGHLIYISDADKRIYLDQKALTSPEDGRFGDFCFDHTCIYAVREVGQINTLAKIEFDGTVTNIAIGSDFYSSPTLSDQGLAWIAWNHPHMPWEQTELWLWDFENEPKCIKSGAAIQNPFWKDQLYFLSDESGFWNLHTLDGPVFQIDADLGYPPWILGLKRMALIDGKIACIATKNATDSLIIYDPVSQNYSKLDLPFTSFGAIDATATHLCAIAASPQAPTCIVKIDPATLEVQTLRKSKTVKLKPHSISLPVALSFPNRSGNLIHVFYYPPIHPDYQGSASEKPPLIMRAHGGPTAHSSPVLNLEVQYWTSRGFAFADVNYGGSSGYGKAYRERLRGQWGIVDVHDVIDAAEYLARKELVDRERMVIKGSSAGGYTALAAITFGDTFAAAVSLYGICDLEALTQTTHKFESHYNAGLIGPYPQAKSTYRERSPIHHLDQIRCPVLLLQGSEDKVVPFEQAQKLYDALLSRNILCTYHLFEGEGHGFRKAETIEKALQLETAFYTQLFFQK